MRESESGDDNQERELPAAFPGCVNRDRKESYVRVMPFQQWMNCEADKKCQSDKNQRYYRFTPRPQIFIPIAGRSFTCRHSMDVREYPREIVSQWRIPGTKDSGR